MDCRLATLSCSPALSADDFRCSGSASPFTRSSSPNSSNSNLLELWVPGSPKSDKMVNVCKNCNYSFRVQPKPSNAADFCGKDCETCFTLFYNMAAPTPTKERTLSEIRESIFQFQQTRLDEDNDRHLAAADCVMMVEGPLTGNVRVTIREPSPSPSKFCTPDKKKIKAVKAQSSTGDGKRSLMSTLTFYTAPRPVRPALHAFF